jgi:hypothetical protein
VREAAHLVAAAIVLGAGASTLLAPVAADLVGGSLDGLWAVFAASAALLAPVALGATLAAARRVLDLQPADALRAP